MPPDPIIEPSSLEIVDSVFFSYGELVAIVLLSVVCLRWLVAARSVTAAVMMAGAGLLLAVTGWFMLAPPVLQVIYIGPEALSWVRGASLALMAVAIWRVSTLPAA